MTSFIPLPACIFAVLLASNAFAAPDYIFVENKGQWEDHVTHRAGIPGGYLYIHQEGFTMLFYHPEDINQIHDTRLADHTVRAHAISYYFYDKQAKRTSSLNIEGSDAVSSRFNYYIGKDRQNWASNAKGYRQVRISNISEGVDLVMYSRDGRLKYDLDIAHEVNPEKVNYRIEGADSLYIKENQLHVKAGFASFSEGPPVIFQGRSPDDGDIIDGNYDLNGNYISYEINEAYNTDAPLIIDPEMIFSTYSGSRGDNFGYTATYDEDQKGYAGGTVFDTGFPVTDGAIQMEFKGGTDINGNVGDVSRVVGLLKFSEDGTQLEYATYLGGSEGNEDPHSMIVNSENELIVFGNTTSSDFPVTENAYDTVFNGSADIYVSRLNSDGTELLSSTFLGGSDADGRNGAYRGQSPGDYYNISATGYNFGDVFRGEVITGPDGQILIATTTQSDDFPVTTGVLGESRGGGLQDACLVSLTPDLDSVLWSTYLGGSEEDAAFGISRHNSGDYIISGATASNDFPVTSGALMTNYPGGSVSGFLARINPSGTEIVAATYLGTDEPDLAFLNDIDPQGYIYVAGQTEGDYPVSGDKYSNPNSGQFIDKLLPDLSNREWSSVFGSGRGAPDISPAAFLVDECARIYYSGWGGETNNFSEGPGGDLFDLPITDDAFQSNTSGSGFYVAIFSANMNNLIYATYLGSFLSHDHVDGGTSRFDDRGNVYQSVCAGCNGGSDFPTTENAWSRENLATRPGDEDAVGCNNVLFRMRFHVSPEITYEKDVCNREVQFTSLSEGAQSYLWKFGDGETSEEMNPAHTYPDNEVYNVMMITDPETECPDTAHAEIDLNYNSPDELDIPNVFTPDGSGVNDTFYIRNLERLECHEYEFLLYNRWGNKVLEKSGEAFFSWDGKASGVPVEPGTYYYIFRAGDREETGVLNIFR